MEKRPQWEKPELIVLVRSEPEETVLETCKTFGLLGPPTNSGCYAGKDPCSELVAS